MTRGGLWSSPWLPYTLEEPERTPHGAWPTCQSSNPLCVVARGILPPLLTHSHLGRRAVPPQRAADHQVPHDCHTPDGQPSRNPTLQVPAECGSPLILSSWGHEPLNIARLVWVT